MSTAIDHFGAAERLARQLQTQVAPSDAAALVHTWDTVAQAAHKAWSALPHPAPTDTRAENTTPADAVMERIALSATSLQHAAGRGLWPGNPPPHRSLAQISDRLQTGARIAAENPPATSGQAGEARRLILSTLWTTSRVVGTAARDHSFDIRYDRTVPTSDWQRISHLAHDTALRFAVAEQPAANTLFARPTTDVSDPPARTLGSGIARWDIQSHRALAGHRTTATLHVISFHQAEFALRIHDLVGLAADDGIIDRSTYDRLSPVLKQAHMAWRDVLDVASEFSFATIQVPPALHQAGANLSKQLADVTPHTPEGHRIVLSAVSDHLASSLDVAALARDLLIDNDLRAPARAVARVIKIHQPHQKQAVVDPADMHAGRTVALPAQARDILDEPINRAVDVTAEARRRSAGLDALYRTPHPRPDRGGRRSLAPSPAPPSLGKPLEGPRR